MNESIKRNIAFDQYQRYETVSKLIELLRKDKQFHLLELGANEHKDLKMFFPNDQILFTDIKLTEKMENDKDFVRADGSDLQFDDNSYDFVIALDVLEHVEEAKRDKFISEMCRVSRFGAILSFPIASQEVMDCEKRINSYYKSITGKDFIWLKEHIENGLPNSEKIEKYLSENNMNYFSFEHGNLEIWEKMWYCHFDTVMMQDSLDYRQSIDRYYNSKIYEQDLKQPCYRKFYVISKNMIEDWKFKALSIWKDNSENLQLDVMLNAHHNLFNVYEKRNLDRLLSEKDEQIKLLQNEVDRQKEIQDLNAEIINLRNRLDESIEEKKTLKIEIEDLNKKIVKLEKNTLCSEQMIENSAIVTNKLNKLKKELEHYQLHYQAAIAQRDDLNRQVMDLTQRYNAISNAFFWKITKPFRVSLDLIKKPFRNNRGLRLIKKGLISLKKDGFKVTWRKTINKLKHHKEYQNLASKPLFTEEELQQQKKHVFEKEIKFSIVVPLYNTPEKFLKEMIQSVLDQTYSNWELCMADGSDAQHGDVEKICKQYAKKDKRIKYKKLEKNLGISENTNACASMATGEYIVLLDHDDLLTTDALYENAVAIEETDADVFYSDEDHLSTNGKLVNPFYKPDWSPDLLYCQMYICHLLVFRRSLFEKIKGFDSNFDGSQDYDLMLRLSEETERICHISKILYHWRESENSTALNADSKPYAHTAGKKALDEHLKRKYGNTAYVLDSEYAFDARFGMKDNTSVSIIIPMKDKWELTNQCIESILKLTTYDNYEILILNNRSEEKETYRWFEKIEKNQKIRVLEADMEFNWSKLNNFGINHSNADVYVFLNNDTVLISEDWLERLCENALRSDIGVVGALLLYPDNTIQHAGVVVGMGGWADHVFKGEVPYHSISPFISPVLSRNVLAVTGACMAVSRKTIEKIGLFDESFIICGSDVELCIRAYEQGLYNRYDANVKLYHLESKSRDTYIPEIDFKRSYEVYTPYRENIDPYFNINLEKDSVIPKGDRNVMKARNFKNYLKKFPLVVKTYQKMKNVFMSDCDYTIPEIGIILPKISNNKEKRLNLLVPSVDKQHVFGGIATALAFFEKMVEKSNINARIIVTDDMSVNIENSVLSNKYKLIVSEIESEERYQLVGYADRANKKIIVRENDIFIASAWWTAYVIADVIRWQKENYSNIQNSLIYLIQDYEPGFYPWSTRYMLADSTYRLDIPTVAVFNSEILAEYFAVNKYSFEKTFVFNPSLNDKLKKLLPKNGKQVIKKKKILVYGRPTVSRNAFELLVYSLKRWSEIYPCAKDWEILSAGEQHDDVDLGNGLILHSVGKLSLEEYSKMLLETYAGISLMVSPHPSYPPLEMATFGIKTITNCYGNKDLSQFSENIISLQSCSPLDIANSLVKICEEYQGEVILNYDEKYVDGDEFEVMIDNIIEEFGCKENLSKVY